MLSIGNELYNAFKRVKGYSLGFFSIGLSVALFIWGPDTKLSLKIIIPLGVLTLLIIAVLVDFGFHCYSRMTNIIPDVKQGLDPPQLYPQAVAMILLSKSDLFATESIVSVYYRDESYEPLIGSGFVFTVQENGLIQIVVVRCMDERYSEVWEKVRSNNSSILEKLIVKPIVPKTLLMSGE